MLRQKIRLAEPWLAGLTDTFWSHPSLPEMFPEYLYTVHASVRATVPLMEVAGRAARVIADHDPVAAGLVDYFREHALEEREHDEWLLRDMAAIGLDRDEILARVPSPAVADLVGSQYYWIYHVHPVALLGFFAVLEGNPPSAEHLREVAARSGLPPEGFRMLLEHAELDPQHGDEVFALIDELPLTDRHATLVSLSALHTIERLGTLFEEILRALRERRLYRFQRRGRVPHASDRGRDDR